MASRTPALDTRPRAREMPIYKRYFDLIASGAKTIEIRVAYPNNQRLTVGDEQLANVRLIYPPEKEALGVMAIHIERC